MRKKPVKKPAKKEKLEAFLVVCEGKIDRSRWLSLDLPRVYSQKSDAQKAAYKRTEERPGIIWTVVKFREAA
jgi:hypothetical protein